MGSDFRVHVLEKVVHDQLKLIISFFVSYLLLDLVATTRGNNLRLTPLSPPHLLHDLFFSSTQESFPLVPKMDAKIITRIITSVMTQQHIFARIRF